MGEGGRRGRDIERNLFDGTVTGEADRTEPVSGRPFAYGLRGVAGSKGAPLGGVGARSIRMYGC